MAYRRKLLFVTLGVCLISMYAGLADYDWYWQCELGEAVVKHADFNAIYGLTWGTQGVAEYLDHEWLTNVFFYLCSLIGYKGISLAKLLICVVYAYSTYLYLNFLTLEACETYTISMRVPFSTATIYSGPPMQKYNDVALLGVFGYLFIMSTVFIKVKAYILSVAFLLIEVYFLKCYKVRSYNKTYFTKMLALMIVWNNMHSGSIPLFFLVAGIFWLTELGRDKQVLKYLPFYLVGLCVNPYGPKLILFDLKHNFDHVMKQIVMDWRCIDAKETLGVICALLVIGVVFFLIGTDLRTHKFDLIMIAVVMFMSFQSARHLIYLAPFIYSVMIDNKYKLDIGEMARMVLVVCIFGFALLSTMQGFGSSTYDKSYAMQYAEPELLELVAETNEDGCDGLYATTNIDLWSHGFQSFASGAFPCTRERMLASYELEYAASDARISELIDEWGLTKFLAVRYNPAISWSDRPGCLYEYLSARSDEYELLYDSDFYYYFVRKDLAT